MNERETKLAEVRNAIKALRALGEEIGEEEAKKLSDLNTQAIKLASLVEADKQAAAFDTEEKARIDREKAEAVAEARRDEAAKARRLSFGGDAPYQAKYSDLSKYDELSAGETALVIETLNTNGRQVSGAAFKALSIKIGELKDDNSEEGRKGVNYVRNAFKASTNIEPTAEATSAAVKAATDPMYTGGSGIGSDWVGTAYSSELWAAIRAANVVVNRVPSEVIPDGYSSKYWPLESTDPTWYKVAEATTSDATLKVPAATIAASQLATANKQLTVGKLGARSLYTGELTEDSLIAFAPTPPQGLSLSCSWTASSSWRS
jgi:hypothetical protein